MRQPKRLRRGVAHNRSPKQEREIAKRMGGDSTPQSGAGPLKGDVKVAGVARIEAKTTTKKSFSVTQSMVSTIEAAAMSAEEIPVIEVEFIDSRGKVKSSVAIMPVWAMELLLGNKSC